MQTGGSEIPARGKRVQGEEMVEAEEVAAMVRLHELGWGAKRLSKEFGCARNTVRRYLRAGARRPSASPSARRRSTVWRTGCASGSSATAGTPTSFARSWRASTGSRSACARWRSGSSAGGGAEGREARDGALRDPARPAIADQTSARLGSGSPRSGSGCVCSSRRSDVRVGCRVRPSLRERQLDSVRGDGGELPPVRGRAVGGPARRCPRLGRAP